MSSPAFDPWAALARIERELGAAVPPPSPPPRPPPPPISGISGISRGAPPEPENQTTASATDRGAIERLARVASYLAAMVEAAAALAEPDDDLATERVVMAAHYATIPTKDDDSK